MKKILITVILLFALSFSFGTFKVLADPAAPDNDTQPTLPQDESQSHDKVATEQISSPQFYSEDSKITFLKGLAAGGAVGIIVGGVIVWFYKKKNY